MRVPYENGARIIITEDFDALSMLAKGVEKKHSPH